MRRYISAVFFLGSLFCFSLVLPGRVVRAEQNRTPLEIFPFEFQPLEDLPTVGQPLEGPIDPKTYRLGPGDLVAVNVVAQVEQQILARVSADGILRIQSLGIFNVGDRFFSEVQAEILEVAKKRYKAEAISVSLVQLRKFKASVGGLVVAPGTYEFTAMDRVMTLVTRAGSFFKTETSKKEEYSTRRVQLIHRDGSKENVDLFLFLRAGLPEGNPLLRDGDFLLIPPLDAKTGTLGIFGSVHQPGIIEYLPGDDLNKALLLAGNLNNEAWKDSIEITRFSEDDSSFKTFYVNLESRGALETRLFPDDRIFIRSKPFYHQNYRIEVRGEVMKPGIYPVGIAGIKLSELIKMAGGFTPRASLSEATLFNSFAANAEDPEYKRLLLSLRTDLSQMENEYLKIKTREQAGCVAVNLMALFEKGDSTQDVQMRSGDILDIPSITNTITLSGQVKNPGRRNYISGQTYLDYVNQSGGFASNADRKHITIIKKRTGTWVKARTTLLEAGDTILVPSKSDFSVWQFTKDVLILLTSFATIFLVIKTTGA